MAEYNPSGFLRISDEHPAFDVFDCSRELSPVPLLADEELADLGPISMDDLDAMLGLPHIRPTSPVPSSITALDPPPNLPEAESDFQLLRQHPNYESLQHAVQRFDRSVHAHLDSEHGVKGNTAMLQQMQAFDVFSPRPFAKLQPNPRSEEMILSSHPMSYQGINNANPINTAYGVNNTIMINDTDATNGINSLNGFNTAYGVHWTDTINWIDGINWTEAINSTNAVNSTNGLNVTKNLKNPNSTNELNRTPPRIAQQKRAVSKNPKDLLQLLGTQLAGSTQEVTAPSTPNKRPAQTEMEIEMWTPTPKKSCPNSAAGSSHTVNKSPHNARGSSATKHAYKTPPRVRKASVGKNAKSSSPVIPGSPVLTASSHGTPTPNRTNRSIGLRIPYPKTWAAASGADVLLFELKNAGGTWEMIEKSYNKLTNHGHTRSALQSRYWGIKKALGDIPHEDPGFEGGAMDGLPQFNPFGMGAIADENANGKIERGDPDAKDIAHMSL